MKYRLGGIYFFMYLTEYRVSSHRSGVFIEVFRRGTRLFAGIKNCGGLLLQGHRRSLVLFSVFLVTYKSNEDIKPRNECTELTSVNPKLGMSHFLVP